MSFEHAAHPSALDFESERDPLVEATPSTEVAGERQLAQALWQRQGDPVALEAFLRTVPSWQRQNAQLILTRSLGGGAASAVCERAFGGTRARPQVPFAVDG